MDTGQGGENIKTIVESKNLKDSENREGFKSLFEAIKNLKGL